MPEANELHIPYLPSEEASYGLLGPTRKPLRMYSGALVCQTDSAQNNPGIDDACSHAAHKG